MGNGFKRGRRGMSRKIDRTILTRRSVLRRTGILGAGLLVPPALALRSALAQQQAPAVVTAEKQRPQIPLGVISGDPTAGRAVIWSKTDRPARMLVDIATREDFSNARRVSGPAALAT